MRACEILGKWPYLRAVANSLIRKSRAEAIKASPYIPRVGKLSLLNAEKSVILIGPPQSGKSVFLAHTILKETYPWWSRLIFPPQGFLLQGNQSAPSARDWFDQELNFAGEGHAMTSMTNAIINFSAKQRVRSFLFHKFYGQLHPIFCPQPTLVIIDQVEELIKHHRSDFVNIVFPLVKLCKGSPNALQLIFVVNSAEAVASLEKLHGDYLFDVIECPKPDADMTVLLFGEKYLTPFNEMDGCIGIVQAYFNTGLPNESPKEFMKRYLKSYNRVHGVDQAVTTTELLLFLDPLARAEDAARRK